MIVVKNQSGLYLLGMKRGKLVWTDRALDAQEFISVADAEQFISSATGAPSFDSLQFLN